MLDMAGVCGPDTGISRVPGIHCFSHQSGLGEKCGGFIIAQFYGFSAGVFLDMSQEALIHNIIGFSGRIGFGDGDEMELNLDGQTWWCFKLPWW